MNDFTPLDVLPVNINILPVKLPPTIELNEEQQAAVAALRHFLDSDEQFFGLFGYAGTGKTTVIQHVFDDTFLEVAMSAPTHKAVGVLSAMAAERGLHRFSFATIHSLCSVKKVRKDGEVKFMLQPGFGGYPIRSFDVVVIDECSMIGEEMWGWIQEAIAPGQKVIVMGDPAQLPPVQETGSPTFKLPHVELSQVMRSRGVVQDAATRIRQNIKAHVAMLAPDGQDEHGEVKNLYQEEWLAEFLAAVTEGTRVKALAFTNTAVDWLNDWVREQKFGRDAKAFEVGERLVLIETHELRGGMVTLHTESDLEVVEAEPTTYLNIDCWRLKVLCYGVPYTIYTLDAEQYPDWSAKVREAKVIGKATKKWQPYYDLIERFARVRPGWATTIHKSQGSTYDKVFLVQTNVLPAGKRDPAFRNMLLYVGYSRARKGLYLS